MTVTRTPFGALPGGAPVEMFTLTNSRGAEVRAMTYGATITSIRTPDRSGQLGDVVLGFDTFDDYLTQGALLRQRRRPLRQPHRQRPVHARRQATTSSPPTTAPTTCTAAMKGFDKVVWQAEPFERDGERRRRLHLHQPRRRGGLSRHADA